MDPLTLVHQPPIVMVGAPVRNRAWILPRYLDALDSVDHPRERLRFAFVVNDCTDGTEAILANWCHAARAASLPGARLVHQSFGPAASKSEERGLYQIEHLAQLRNRLLDEFMASDAEYLLSLDTDILLPPGALPQLLADDRHVVAGLIRNDGHMTARAEPYFNICRRTGPGTADYVHIHELPADPLFEVDLTGAVILIRRNVVAAGVRYKATLAGEDAGFCLAAQAAGFTLWCDQRVRPDHIMTREVRP